MEQVLEQFVDRLVEEKKFPDLDPEVMAQIRSDIGERLERRINLALIEHMPEGKLGELEAKLDADNDVELQQFYKDNIPNLEEVVATTLMDFRKTYLGV